MIYQLPGHPLTITNIPSLHSPPPARCPGNRNWKDCKELVISNTLLALCLLVAHPGLALQTLEVS
uniref:Uncharacterized protein n=1 Tax=Myotis myotis TaxID=51298 RepID=A0A7J7WHS9_MYOMY|nr:hypothetical protein mMyoMyo1_012155 [Myotis myotis]